MRTNQPRIEAKRCARRTLRYRALHMEGELLGNAYTLVEENRPMWFSNASQNLANELSQLFDRLLADQPLEVHSQPNLQRQRHLVDSLGRLQRHC